MPNARKINFDDQTERRVDGAQLDLQSLLREGHLDSLHARGKVLFAEGEPARGVYLLHSGTAAVSVSSRDGKIVILRTARAGDVLGLNCVLRNLPYDTTVRTLQSCRTGFISRVELLELLQTNPRAAHAIAGLLSRELSELTDRTRSLLLLQTTGARLAKLLLQWCQELETDTSGYFRIDRVFTHEEIAHMISASRETVTRLLASLSRRQIIRMTADSIVVKDLRSLYDMTCVKAIT